jgi:hypothetical protein
MFIRLLVTSILFILVVRAVAVTNSSKGQIADALTLPKQPSLYDDYDINDHKTNVEGSGGGAASLDEYADDEEEEQLSKVTATTVSSSPSTTTRPMTTTTTKLTSSTTTLSNKWSKTTFNYDQPKKKNVSSTTSSTFNDLDANEFKEDHEEYADDLEDDAYYNEPTVSNKVSMSSFSSTRYPIPSTRQPSTGNLTTPIWALFSFLTRPPIAAGILAGKNFYLRKTEEFYLNFVGLAIGIFTSVILLICIIRRYHKREKSHSSYTTGLLYPNQYGYAKSPQEFYA